MRMNKNRWLKLLEGRYSRYSVATGSGWKFVGGAFQFTNTLILVSKVIILTTNDNMIITRFFGLLSYLFKTVTIEFVSLIFTYKFPL